MILLGHLSAAEKETVDIPEGASTGRGISEGLGRGTWCRGARGRRGAVYSPGGTNSGGLEGRRSEELTKKNMPDVIPLTHTQCSDHSDMKSWEAPCGAVITILSPPGLRAPARCGLGLWDLCPQQRPHGYSLKFVG